MSQKTCHPKGLLLSTSSVAAGGADKECSPLPSTPLLSADRLAIFSKIRKYLHSRSDLRVGFWLFCSEFSRPKTLPRAKLLIQLVRSVLLLCLSRPKLLPQTSLQEILRPWRRCLRKPSMLALSCTASPCKSWRSAKRALLG